ncbi:M56 family metallopeptidase [Novosphingobium sp. ZW T3_23]|uniref:M56 family metallopeptidase n=1 Tax=Novosphingobium sp. ZW T3_23 TaxID=3378084 RepID=UPI003853A996
MIEWLTDTLVMTGALMALILLVRRPVSRWFGPAAAYALWALPVLRLVLPPLALPRGLFARPEIAAEPVAATHQAIPAAVQAIHPLAATDNVPAMSAGEIDPGILSQIPWFQLAVAIWLIGAAVFLVQRFRNYRLMRAELLTDAHQVAHAGDIRIVETPMAASPLAFGVRNKVVALPQGFLATVDSESSDFAIAHELEHHAGNDLLALIVLQPLFALHWFNPLGWAAWRALRADQEAACDARVMAGRDRATRARYGRVIASFAAGPRLTLAAPIAGALAGEKPIIQRLKALATAEISPGRRVMARSLFAFAVISVPCTATVTYAAMEERDGAEASDVPQVPEVPSVPAPAAPSASLQYGSEDGEVPPPAPAPEAPQAPEVSEAVAVSDGSWMPAPPVPPVPPVPLSRGSVPPAPPIPPAPPRSLERDRQAADRQAARADYRAAMANALRNVPKVEQSTTADGKIQTIRIVHKGEDGRREIRQTISIDSTCPADRQQSASRNRGGSSTHICTGVPLQAMNASLRGISTARASIASNRSLSSRVRSEILAELDGEMADVRAEMADQSDR